ncbi:endo alpha-1,4 polygalactosaminidase [Aquifex sp.]
MRFITGLICLGISFLLTFGTPLGKCVAFFYGGKAIPDDLLYAYDWLVVSPENPHLKVVKEKFYMKKRGKLIAYLSVGEMREREIPRELRVAILGDNPAWKTKVMDIRKKAYRDFLVKNAEKLLSEFDGIFLDTLDSYKLVLKESDWKSYEEALKEFINYISSKYPDKIILLNRGFEVIEGIKDVDGVVVESLLKERNPEAKISVLNYLKRLKEKGLEIILVEYERDRKKAEELIKEANSLGFSIYVSPDLKLQSFGLSQCKILPRKVVLLYDSSIFPEPHSADVHRLVQLPLEYLGFIPVLVDVNGKLPEVSPEAGYVGIVTMGISKSSRKLDRWLARAKGKGLKLFFLKYLPFSDTDVLDTFGIKVKKLTKPTKVENFRVNKEFAFFEAPYVPELTDRIIYSQGVPVVQARVGRNIHTPFVLTDWGGFAVGNSFLNNQELWVFNPFEIFRRVFKPSFPVPDITTENGNRILTAHIDGDSFFGISEVNPKKRNAEVIRDEILKKYKIPHTVSVIEAEIAPWGLYPQDSPLLEEIARSIFKLENVEPASHSFSHPFNWNPKVDFLYKKTIEMYGYNLPVKGYTLNVKREILGSIEYINTRLLENKKVKVFLWTGYCNPTEEALRLTYLAKVYNVNGGDTIITNERPFLKYVSPSGINVGKYFQVYAPIQNENIYTNEWTGPLWGYIKVISSFKLTEKPYRLKPISIYYHFYSGQKWASLNALKKVYEYALSQETTPLYLSEYAHKVLDFRQTAIIKLDDGFLIKNDGEVRTLRIPKTWGYPDLKRSKGVAGFKEEERFFYIHLDGSGRYLLRFSKEIPPFWLERANGKVEVLAKENGEFLYRFKSHVPLKAVFKNNSCKIYFQGKAYKGREVVIRGGKREEVKVLCPN